MLQGLRGAALLAAERSRVAALQQFLEEAGHGSAAGFDSPAGDIDWPEISRAVASSGESTGCLQALQVWDNFEAICSPETHL